MDSNTMNYFLLETIKTKNIEVLNETTSLKDDRI
jgi:hypothetical protein